MLLFKPVLPGVSAEELRRTQGGSSTVTEQDQTHGPTNPGQPTMIFLSNDNIWIIWEYSGILAQSVPAGQIQLWMFILNLKLTQFLTLLSLFLTNTFTDDNKEICHYIPGGILLVIGPLLPNPFADFPPQQN